MTEDEMVGWYHQVNGYESEQAPGDGEGQGSLACCCPWSCKELDMIGEQNNRKSLGINVGRIGQEVNSGAWPVSLQRHHYPCV